MKNYLYNLIPIPMKHIQMLVFVLLAFFLKNDLQAQCTPDVTPPVAVCDLGLIAALDANGQLTIWATDFDDGSYDACTSVNFYIEDGLPPSPTPPTTQSLDFDSTDVGLHDIVMWVVDQAGNSNVCISTLEITGLSAQCNPDVTPPVPYCLNGLTATLDASGNLTVWGQDFDAGSYDNCSAVDLFIEEAMPPSSTPPTTQSLNFNTSDVGSHNIVLWVTDHAGISDYCTVTLEIEECQGTQNLACNDNVLVTLSANDTAVIEPDWILEGGPYCNIYGLEFIGGGGFPGMPFLVVDTSDIGVYTVAVYDTQTGNACWGTVTISGSPGSTGCSPDVTPPVAVCDAYTVLTLGVGPSTISAQTFDDGSYDNCAGPLSFFAEEGLPPSSNPPTTQSLTFDFSDLGLHDIVMWVVDQAGNSNYCIVTLEVKGCPSSATPVCNAIQTIGIPASGSIEIDPFVVLEGGPYCNAMGIDFAAGSTPPGFPFITLDTSHIGTTQQVVVYDQVTGTSCWGEIEVVDCQNDTIKPVPVCYTGLVVEMGKVVPHELTVWGTDFNAGSYDNCTAILDFTIEVGPTPSAQAPSTASLTFNESEIGTHEVVMWAIDAAGNENYCITTLEIIAPKCGSDTSPPICTAPANTSISLANLTTLGIDPNNEADLAMYFGQVDADDNCGVETILKTVNLIDGGQCGLQQITRSFVAVDSSGNLSQPCQQIITVYSTWEIHLPEDYYPGDPAIDSVVIISPASSAFGINYEDFTIDVDCDGNADKILRKWTVLDWCSVVNPSANHASIGRLDLNGDGQDGDGFTITNAQDSIYLLENGQPTTALAGFSPVVEYIQVIRLNYNDTLHFTLNGTVFHDGNDDCGLDSAETALAGWPVLVTGLNSGETQSTFTDSLGQYTFELCTTDTLVEVSLDVPFNYGAVCGTTHTVQFSPGISQSVFQDIPVNYDTLCPILWVDISAPFLRRCFNNYYTVNYCNYSDETIEGVYVEVQLDPFMTFTSSGLPGTHLGGNLYTFDLGNVDAGACNDFKIYFDLECSAVLGATHCVDAHIFPDTLCPNPVNWSGANIEVDAFCENDTVYLSITNTGNAAMAGPLEYIVVEDVIMLNMENFNLGQGATHEVPPIHANGATYRIEAQQEPGHPFPGIVAKSVEGCNGINIFGLVNLFPLENPNPFIASDCQQNIGSFDPNDKQAFPAGYGDEHFIERNVDLDYLIRFQNTGTDTAFKVVIIDELDPSLNPASVRPGAASHDYQFELIEGNKLRFTFHDIMLPDSNTNEVASHGFIKFKASQIADLPLGTVIENEAAIYFDFNDPVITNKVFHTLGEHFVEVVNDTNERPAGLGDLLTYPNPSPGDVLFKIPATAPVEAVFHLYDALGKQLVVDAFSANMYHFERGGLAPGVYFYTVEVQGLGQYNGKIILQ
ncbi:MAG: T9SS type A sorting domain-containing protein [Saprospiraceae bacterium]